MKPLLLSFLLATSSNICFSQGPYQNDIGFSKADILLPEYGGNNEDIFSPFVPGLVGHNYGLNPQSTVRLIATIKDPTQSVIYTDTIGPIPLGVGDTINALPDSNMSFNPFSIDPNSYTSGAYMLYYEIESSTDDFLANNKDSIDFTISNFGLSYAHINNFNEPRANIFPTVASPEYQSCMVFQDSEAEQIDVGWGMEIFSGITIVPHGDTSVTPFAGSEIFVNLYRWDDAWTDLNDPNHDFTSGTGDAYDSIYLITFGTFYPNSEAENSQPVHVPFYPPAQIENDVRYLACVQTFETQWISFGYDTTRDYTLNESYHAQPIMPVFKNGNWHIHGWPELNAPSINLDIESWWGLEEQPSAQARVSPNPFTDEITVELFEKQDGAITIYDLKGKKLEQLFFKSTESSIELNTTSLKKGSYICQIRLKNGQQKELKVIKQ